MKNIDLTNLPQGARVRGAVYDDPSHEYLLGDVLEIKLPTGRTIDVGWDKHAPGGPFRIVVYGLYFGDRLVDYRVRDAEQVVIDVQRLALDYSQPFVASAKYVEQVPKANYGEALERRINFALC